MCARGWGQDLCVNLQPEEAFATFTCPRIKVVTFGLISTHATGPGVFIFQHLILFISQGECFSDGLHWRRAVVHSRLEDDGIVQARSLELFSLLHIGSFS